jgi:hypothetical protein
MSNLSADKWLPSSMKSFIFLQKLFFKVFKKVNDIYYKCVKSQCETLYILGCIKIYFYCFEMCIIYYTQICTFSFHIA